MRRPIIRTSLMLLVAIQLLSTTRPAHAAWPAGGTQISAPPDRPYDLVLSNDGSGGAFIQWSRLQGGSGVDLSIASHVFSNGILDTRWSVSGKLLAGTLSNDCVPLATRADGQGGMYALIHEYLRQPPFPNDPSGALYLRRLNADATNAVGWTDTGLRIRDTGTRSAVMVPLFPDAHTGVGIAIARRRNGSILDLNILVQRVLPSGEFAPGWSDSGTALCTAAGLRNDIPYAVADGAGGLCVLWDDHREGYWRPYANRVTAEGTLAPGWRPDGIPVCDSLQEQFISDACGDGAGGFYVAVTDFRNDPDGDIYLHHLRGDGSHAPGWPEAGLPICELPNFQQSGRVVPDGTGGVIIVWEDYRSSIDIYGSHLAADGSRLPGWPQDGLLISSAPGDVGQLNNRPILVSDQQGGAYASWQQGTVNVNWVAHVLGNGATAPGWIPGGVPVPDPSVVSGGGYYSLDGDGQGGLLVAWTDYRLGGYDAQIFAQRFGSSGGVVAIEYALIDSDVSDDGVHLRWSTSRTAGSALPIERRTPAGAWQVLGIASVDGGGMLRFVDASAEPGERYAYRVGTSDATHPASPETWVDVPRTLRFALAGGRPNPARGSELALEFTLPTRDPATLEMFDVSGRRVLAREVGGLGPGSHRIAMGASSSPLRAGIYWARLSQGENHATARVVVIDR